MSAVLFDTLRRSRTLRDKGNFTTEQAEALAEALGDTTQDNLATKADISSLKAEITAVNALILTIESRLESKIEKAKAELMKWVVGAIGFQTIAIIGAVIALARITGK